MSQKQTEHDDKRQTALQVRDTRVFAFMNELEKAANLPAQIQTGVVKMLEKKIQYMMDWEIAEMIAGSELVPKDYIGKPNNVFLAVQTGRSLGLDEFQSVRHLYTVGGRTSIYGDMMLALAKKHPDFDDIFEEEGELVDTGKDRIPLPKWTKCTVKRKNGKSDIVRTYTIEMAMRNPNYQNVTWKGNGARMMQFRVRSFALRDAFPDKLSGVYDEYEIEEVKESKDITGQVQDLGKQSATDRLKDIVTDEPNEDQEATEPEMTIETDRSEPEEQPEPENLSDIKTDIKAWREAKLIDDETFQRFGQAGSKGQWNIVVDIHAKLKNSFVVRLASVVDLPEYATAIQSLIDEGKVNKQSGKNNDFRTKDEATAKRVFELIEETKSFEDSEKAEAETEETV
ncbi:recombinase RecT [bacterium]|nr:recombinase RecT [bacterium]